MQIFFLSMKTPKTDVKRILSFTKKKKVEIKIIRDFNFLTTKCKYFPAIFSFWNNGLRDLEYHFLIESQQFIDCLFIREETYREKNMNISCELRFLFIQLGQLFIQLYYLWNQMCNSVITLSAYKYQNVKVGM